MTTNDRLIAAQKAAHLSVTDMANWHDCSRSSMRAWLDGVVPAEHRTEQIEDKLILLEKAIKEGGHFPVPLSTTQFERKAYILQVRNDIVNRISTPRPAGGRRKMLGGNPKGCRPNI